MSGSLPSPPRVFAPDRLGTDRPADPSGSVSASSLTSSGAAAPRGDSAQVTAVVGPVRAAVPPVTAPPATTAHVATPAPPSGHQLARTGLDTGPLLLLAVVLVLLGLAVLRLAVPRAAPSR